MLQSRLKELCGGDGGRLPLCIPGHRGRPPIRTAVASAHRVSTEAGQAGARERTRRWSSLRITSPAFLRSTPLRSACDTRPIQDRIIICQRRREVGPACCWPALELEARCPRPAPAPGPPQARRPSLTPPAARPVSVALTIQISSSPDPNRAPNDPLRQVRRSHPPTAPDSTRQRLLFSRQPRPPSSALAHTTLHPAGLKPSWACGFGKAQKSSCGGRDAKNRD